jgi:hypothetical protein
MSDKCRNCPCPDICMAKPTWCEWMAAPNPHPTQIKGICDRSRIGIVTPNRAEFPSIGQQAANFAGATARTVVAAVTGKQVYCTPEQKAEREAICKPCDKLINGRCVLCGCPYLRKLERATEDCPIGRWQKLEVAS